MAEYHVSEVKIFDNVRIASLALKTYQVTRLTCETGKTINWVNLDLFSFDGANSRHVVDRLVDDDGLVIFSQIENIVPTRCNKSNQIIVFY